MAVAAGGSGVSAGADTTAVGSGSVLIFLVTGSGWLCCAAATDRVLTRFASGGDGAGAEDAWSGSGGLAVSLLLALLLALSFSSLSSSLSANRSSSSSDEKASAAAASFSSAGMVEGSMNRSFTKRELC